MSESVLTDEDERNRDALEDGRRRGWPPGVRPISFDDLSALGIHVTEKALYWNGKEIVTRKIVRLGWLETALAAAVAFGTLGSFIVSVGQSADWWP